MEEYKTFSCTYNDCMDLDDIKSYTSYLLKKLDEILLSLNIGFTDKQLESEITKHFPISAGLMSSKEIELEKSGTYRFGRDPYSYPLLQLSSDKHKNLTVYAYKLETVIFKWDSGEFQAYSLD